jgi:hypothetical protein
MHGTNNTLFLPLPLSRARARDAARCSLLVVAALTLVDAGNAPSLLSTSARSSCSAAAPAGSGGSSLSVSVSSCAANGPACDGASHLRHMRACEDACAHRMRARCAAATHA